MVKNFLVFAGDFHYPDGGWGDYKEGFGPREEAIAFLDKHKCEWGHVVCLMTEEKVYTWYKGKREE